MGVQLGNTKNADIYREHMQKVITIIGNRTANPLIHKDIIFNLTPNKRKVVKSSEIVHSFVRNIISARRKQFTKADKLEPKREDENM